MSWGTRMRRRHLYYLLLGLGGLALGPLAGKCFLAICLALGCLLGRTPFLLPLLFFLLGHLRRQLLPHGE